MITQILTKVFSFLNKKTKNEEVKVEISPAVSETKQTPSKKKGRKPKGKVA